MRNILQLSTNGEIISTYTSTHLAAKATGILQPSINKCLNKKLKTAGGYRWLYEDKHQIQPADKKTVWFWMFPSLEEKLYEIIVADHNAKCKQQKGMDQLHHKVPQYVYFLHQLIQEESHHKEINCGTYAKICCDSRSNFKYVVKAWLSLGVVEIVVDSEEHINEDGKKEFNTRIYKLADGHKNTFKQKMVFDETYGKMIREMISYNEGQTHVSDCVPKAITGPLEPRTSTNEPIIISEDKVAESTSIEPVTIVQKSTNTNRIVLTNEEWMERTLKRLAKEVDDDYAVVDLMAELDDL